MYSEYYGKLRASFIGDEPPVSIYKESRICVPSMHTYAYSIHKDLRD